MAFIDEALFGSTQLSLLWICAIVAAMVFVALVYSTATFRPAPSSSADLSKDRRRNVLREVVWTIVPIFIVVAAALPAITASMPSQHANRLVTENRVACEREAEPPSQHLMALHSKSPCVQQR